MTLCRLTIKYQKEKKQSKPNYWRTFLSVFLRRDFPVAETSYLKKYFKFICHWCEQGYSPQESCEIVVKESQRKAGTTAKPFEMALIALNRKVTQATTSCKSTGDTVPYFGSNGQSVILCLWSLLLPLWKLVAMQDNAHNFKEQLWMGGRREIIIISHRPVTSSDLKQER